MGLKKYEDFEHDLEESDKKERIADFKSAIEDLFGKFEGENKSSIKVGPLVVYNPETLSQKGDTKDTLLINRGTGTPLIRVKILGYAE